MPRVQRLASQLDQARQGAVAVALSSRQQGPRATQTDLADGKIVGFRMAGEEGLGLGPPAEPHEALGAHCVEVARSAAVDAGPVDVGDTGPRDLHGLLGVPHVQQHAGEVERGESPGLRGGRRLHSFTTPSDRFLRVAEGGSSDAEHTASHDPRRPVEVRLRHRLEQPAAPVLRGLVVAGHQFGLSEPGDGRCCPGAVVAVGQQHGGRLELGGGLGEPARRPEVAAEPFVAPGLTEGRCSDGQGLGCELDRSLVADGSAGQLGRLPQPVASGGVCRRGTGRLPELEGSFQEPQGGAGSDRPGGVGGRQSAR